MTIVKRAALYARLRDMGANVMLVPSAFTMVTGMAHWHALLRARAIENQCYIIAAAQCGKHNGKRVSYGHSLVVNPWGDVLADAGSSIPAAEDDTPGSIFVADLHTSAIADVREKMPVAQHIRNDLY